MMTVIHALILLCCVRQMRMIQNGIMIAVIHELILLWCVHQMRMFQRGIMITVIHVLILLRSARQMRMVNSHSCIHITMVCTEIAYDPPHCGVYIKCVCFKVES